jgi:hypothetical protein
VIANDEEWVIIVVPGWYSVAILVEKEIAVGKWDLAIQNVVIANDEEWVVIVIPGWYSIAILVEKEIAVEKWALAIVSPFVVTFSDA